MKEHLDDKDLKDIADQVSGFLVGLFGHERFLAFLSFDPEMTEQFIRSSYKAIKQKLLE